MGRDVTLETLSSYDLNNVNVNWYKVTSPGIYEHVSGERYCLNNYKLSLFIRDVNVYDVGYYLCKIAFEENALECDHLVYLHIRGGMYLNNLLHTN